MKFLLLVLIALGIAAWIGLGLHHDPGMMVVTFAGWRVDMPLWLGIIAFILIYLLVYLTIRLIAGIFHTTQFLANLSNKLSKKRAKRTTNKGFVALAEGNYQKAEKLLAQSADHSETKWLNYLSAAKAAQELGKIDRRDLYLKRALESTPESEVAVEITKASLQYQHQQYEKSLATLIQLRHQVPDHPSVLRLLQKVYFHMQDWEKLIVLLPKLKHQHVLSAQELKDLEQHIYGQLLLKQSNSIEELESIWHKIPKELRLQGKVASIYASALMKFGKPIEAEEVLRNALKHEWHEDLIRLYGHLSHPASQKLLNVAEGWLNLHPMSPSLLLTLGRLCQEQQLWGKAQRYFEASLSLEPHPETYKELGTLLEKMNKPELGAHYFKKGLLLASNTTIISEQRS